MPVGFQSLWIWQKTVYLLAILVLGGLSFVGCGSRPGPQRYDLSGRVSYKGQPVPTGYIIFAPDVAKGNNGPGTQAEIKDGFYQTPRGQGTIGGPHTVSIFGFDGKPIEMVPGLTNPQGNPLFTNYQIHVDLPKQNAQMDFHVPARHSH